MKELIVTGAAIAAASKIKEDSLLGLLYKDTLQPSVQVLGRALSNTIEFCTTPLLLCKFGSEAAQLNFKKRLDNYAQKLDGIPKDKALPVNPQIGIPILDRLTYTTNDEIAELFISLLTKASSTETVNIAHPAFLHLIDRLTPDEALILESIKGEKNIPFVGLKANLKDSGGHIVIKDNQTKLPFTISMQFATNATTYMDNLTSLGILTRHDDLWMIDDSIYDDLYEKHHYKLFEEAIIKNKVYDGSKRTKGIYKVTDFGRSFIDACTA